jgi:hypothetical protein
MSAKKARERQRRHREREAAGLPTSYWGARTRAGTPCRRPAGAGTDHPGHGACSRHGGSTPTHRAKAAREQVAQHVEVTARRLQIVDAGDVFDLALAVANHRQELVQQRYGAQLDGGDLALLSIEGETLDRAARIAKLTIDLDIDRRRAQIARAGEGDHRRHGRRPARCFPGRDDAGPRSFRRCRRRIADPHETKPSELLDGSKEDR